MDRNKCLSRKWVKKVNGSIHRRGNGTWELTIDLGKDANGKRLRKFVKVKGTRAQAAQKKRELLTFLDKGIPIGTSKISFAQWLSRWFAEYVIPNTKTKSQEKYESLIRNHIVPSLGDIELAKITPSDLQSLEARLLAEGWLPRVWRACITSSRVPSNTPSAWRWFGAIRPSQYLLPRSPGRKLIPRGYPG